MRFFNRFRSRPVARLIDEPDGRLRDTDDLTISSGPRAIGSIGVPAMTACVSLLSAMIASLPRQVVNATTGEPIPGHELDELMNQNHRGWPGDALWEYLIRSSLCHGIGYAWRVRGQGFDRLVPCDPRLSTVTQRTDGSGRRRLVYDLHPLIGAPRRTDVPPQDVLVVVGDGYDGLHGLSPVMAYGLTMGILEGANQHLSTTLRKGMHVTGVVHSDVEVGQGMGWDLARISELRKKLMDLFAGTRRAGGVPVLPPGFQFTHVPYNAVDIELIKLLELSIEDVCRIYRVPPRLVYHYRSGVRYNQDAEMANSEFAQYSIEPRTRLIAQHLTSQLLSSDDRARREVEIHLDTQRLYAGSTTQRIDAMDRAVARGGLITPNEARTYIETGRMPRLPPLPGGDSLMPPRGSPRR